MHIDPSTLLFYGLSNDEANDLLELTDALVFDGKMHHDPWNHPLVRTWLDAGDFDERQMLLVMSTVFPIRVYKSLLMRRLVEGELRVHSRLHTSIEALKDSVDT